MPLLNKKQAFRDKNINEAIQQTRAILPVEKAIINLLYTHSWLHSEINAILRGFGLSVPQYNVLRILKGCPTDHYSLKDISDRMIEKNSNVSRIVDRLKSKELCQRTVHPKNRRKVAILLTDKGMLLLNEIEPILRNFYRNFGKINNQEAEQLSNLLDKLRC